MYKELANMGSSKHLGRLFQRNTKRSCFYVGKQNGGFKEKQKKGFQVSKLQLELYVAVSEAHS
jgi:hypothetical protein